MKVCNELKLELKLVEGATQHPLNNKCIHHRHVNQAIKYILLPLVALSGSGV